MENQNKLIFSISLFFFFFFILLTGFQVAQASHHHHSHSHRHNHQKNIALSKLFVFGDSYADTGNTRKTANPWIMPYGTTFPGKPAGRFSDGRVLTDYIASFMKIKSPIPYKYRKVGKKLLPNGMNFAHGGTGVFDTPVPGPNMTTQIHFLQKLLREEVYIKHDLETSVALLSVAGNDYGTFTAKNGTLEGLLAFVPTLVTQIGVDLKAVHDLGVKKVVVTGLQPLGCLPNGPGRSVCNDTENSAVSFHNSLLQDAVAKLNNQTTGSPFVIIDLYTAFMSAFKSQGDRPGTLKFQTPLKACCTGINKEYSCGSVDANATKKYTVCSDPKSTFFWDDVHPTEMGWRTVYSGLQASLHQLYY